MPETPNDFEAQSFDPVVKQLQYSTLESAVDAGAIDAYLSLNHRSYARLSRLPSTIIYQGQMFPADIKQQDPVSVLQWNKFLKASNPKQRDGETAKTGSW